MVLLILLGENADESRAVHLFCQNGVDKLLPTFSIPKVNSVKFSYFFKVMEVINENRCDAEVKILKSFEIDPIHFSAKLVSEILINIHAIGIRINLSH